MTVLFLVCNLFALCFSLRVAWTEFSSAVLNARVRAGSHLGLSQTLGEAVSLTVECAVSCRVFTDAPVQGEEIHLSLYFSENVYHEWMMD